MTEVEDAIYSELAKWERHRHGHSPGYLNLSRDHLWFVPHERSILDKGFDVPLSSITHVDRSDNWLWRGAVDIYLSQELKIEFEFRVDPEALSSGMEERVFSSDKLRLFLGSARKEFLRLVQEIGPK